MQKIEKANRMLRFAFWKGRKAEKNFLLRSLFSKQKKHFQRRFSGALFFFCTE